MKAKYFLARLLCDNLQYSDEHWTSYKEAMKVRDRQVNPGQWLIVVNPYIPRKRINLKSNADKQAKQLDDAYKLIREAKNILGELLP